MEERSEEPANNPLTQDAESPSLTYDVNQTASLDKPAVDADSTDSWATRVRIGRKVTNVSGVHGPPSITEKTKATNSKRKASSIIGKASVTTIKTVKRTREARVFASRFSPDLDAASLQAYLQDKCNLKVQCERLMTRKDTYSSFKISAECQHPRELLDPHLWPEGTYVRRFYEPTTKGKILAIPNVKNQLLNQETMPVDKDTDTDKNLRFHPW